MYLLFYIRCPDVINIFKGGKNRKKSSKIWFSKNTYFYIKITKGSLTVVPITINYNVTKIMELAGLLTLRTPH